MGSPAIEDGRSRNHSIEIAIGSSKWTYLMVRVHARGLLCD